MNILFNWRLWLISLGLSILLVACSRYSGLGDIISLQLVEKTAKDNNRYCYTKENRDVFCMEYRGKEGQP